MVLMLVMMVTVLMLVALTATLPRVYQEGQREREAETIFRGIQYGRAVALFHRQFNRYPMNLKELEGTNNIRFLRKEYKDPLDPDGKWRFVHANAMGVLIDSKNQPINNPANPGNPAGTGGQNPSAVGGDQPAQTGQTNQGSPSAFFGNSNDVQGGFLVGVAPTSHHESIRVWNKHRHYDEWEFVGVDLGLLGMQVGLPGMSGGPIQQPSQPMQGGAPGVMNPPGPQNPQPSPF